MGVDGHCRKSKRFVGLNSQAVISGGSQKNEGFVFGFRDLLWVSVGQYFIFGALCPSTGKSGLMNKHIVKHIAKHESRSPRVVILDY